MLENDLKKYSRSCMSNAKWRKLFSVVNQSSLELGWCSWKLVDEKDSILGRVPEYNRLGDTYVGDCGALNGPFEFRIIEWLLLPAKHGYRPYDKAPMTYIHQNLDEVREKIDAIGQYEYEMTEEGLKIYGYKV